MSSEAYRNLAIEFARGATIEEDAWRPIANAVGKNWEDIGADVEKIRDRIRADERLKAIPGYLRQIAQHRAKLDQVQADRGEYGLLDEWHEQHPDEATKEVSERLDRLSAMVEAMRKHSLAILRNSADPAITEEIARKESAIDAIREEICQLEARQLDPLAFVV